MCMYVGTEWTRDIESTTCLYDRLMHIVVPSAYSLFVLTNSLCVTPRLAGTERESDWERRRKRGGGDSQTDGQKDKER